MRKENKNEPKITKKDVELYEACRQSGKTNMFDIKMVQFLTGLNREKLIYIMEHYSELLKKYKIDRNSDLASAYDFFKRW